MIRRDAVVCHRVPPSQSKNACRQRRWSAAPVQRARATVIVIAASAAIWEAVCRFVQNVNHMIGIGMKKALVCGAGGFIGCHLVKKLKNEGYWVRGVDIKQHEWSPNAADEFQQLDLRVEENCRNALMVDGDTFDE